MTGRGGAAMDAVEGLTPAKRGVMIGVPLLLGALEVFHPPSPFLPGGSTVVEMIAAVRVWWVILHIVQLPLFALLGVVVLWVLPARGTARRGCPDPLL